MQLRGYRGDDLDSMYRLDIVCFERRFRFTRSAMRRFAEAKKALVVIAETGESLVGFCILHVEQTERGRAGYVVTLDVDPQHRHKGIAASLMAEAAVQAAETKCSALALHVYVGNAEAIGFYERIGFKYSHTVGEFYGEGLDAMVYHRMMK